MVKVWRGRPPAELQANKQAWTDRWKRIRAGQEKGDWAPRAAAQLLKDSLRPLTHGKCVYCESLLEVDAYLEIEHYVPKTLDEDQVFEWHNLFPACHMCNVKKGAKAPVSLIKPDVEDPEPYFEIDWGTGELEPHPSLGAEERRKAEKTIELCGLQRGALCEKRYKLLLRLGRLLIRIAQAGSLDNLARQDLDDLLDPQTEHKLVVRLRLKQAGADDLVEEDRRRFRA